MTRYKGILPPRVVQKWSGRPKRRDVYVPLSVRGSRVTTWLWVRCPYIDYDLGRKLARWLP